MVTHSSISLAWEIQGERSLAGYSPSSHKESDTTELTHIQGDSMFTFWGVSRLFSKVYYFTFLIAVYEGTNFSTSSPVLVLHEFVSSSNRGNVNLLDNIPILVYMPPKQELTHLFIIHIWSDIPLWFWFTICVPFLETCLFRSFLIFLISLSFYFWVLRVLYIL